MGIDSNETLNSSCITVCTFDAGAGFLQVRASAGCQVPGNGASLQTRIVRQSGILYLVSCPSSHLCGISLLQSQVVFDVKKSDVNPSFLVSVRVDPDNRE